MKCVMQVSHSHNFILFKRHDLIFCSLNKFTLKPPDIWGKGNKNKMLKLDQFASVFHLAFWFIINS